MRCCAWACCRGRKGKERVKFKAMVVGATGAIGSACARLLVRAAEEVYLVSPETAKLLALKASILQETPGAKVVLPRTRRRATWPRWTWWSPPPRARARRCSTS